MNKTIKIIGKIVIWIVFPPLIVFIAAYAFSYLIPGGLGAFGKGATVAAVFSVPFVLCKVWDKICDKKTYKKNKKHGKTKNTKKKK